MKGPSKPRNSLSMKYMTAAYVKFFFDLNVCRRKSIYSEIIPIAVSVSFKKKPSATLEMNQHLRS